jgi:hypothetical protein
MHRRTVIWRLPEAVMCLEELRRNRETAGRTAGICQYRPRGQLDSETCQPPPRYDRCKDSCWAKGGQTRQANWCPTLRSKRTYILINPWVLDPVVLFDWPQWFLRSFTVVMTVNHGIQLLTNAWDKRKVLISLYKCFGGILLSHLFLCPRKQVLPKWRHTLYSLHGGTFQTAEIFMGTAARIPCITRCSFFREGNMARYIQMFLKLICYKTGYVPMKQHVTVVAVENNKHYVFWVCVCSLSCPACKAHMPCGFSCSTVFFHIIW